MLHWRYFRFIQPFFWTCDSPPTSSWLRQDRYTNSWSEAADGTLWNENCQTLKSGEYSTAIQSQWYVKILAEFYETTPNVVVPTMLGVVASVLAVVCKRMRQLPTMLRPAVHRGKDTTQKTLKTMSNARAWPQQWCPGPRLSLSPKTPFPFPFKRLPRRLMLEELCKRIQHFCATPRWSRNERDVGSCWFESLTRFKLNFAQQLPTTCNNM